MARTLEWSEAYSVGHPALDDEHREIMFAIGRIAGGGDDQARLRPLLCDLKQKTAAHFAHEDAILREIVASTTSLRNRQRFLAAMSEALVQEHLSGHVEALSVLDSMICDTLRSGDAQLRALGESLAHWFVCHAVKHDAHLKTLFQTIQSDCPELMDRVA